MPDKLPAQAGRERVIISGVAPEIDDGRYPIKRTIGESVVVEADAFCDGHDAIRVELAYRAGKQRKWRTAPMEALVNDRWRGSFVIEEQLPYRYTIRAWVDPFGSWVRDMRKRVAAQQEVTVELQIGAGLLERAAKDATGDAQAKLREFARLFVDEKRRDDALTVVFSAELHEIMDVHAPRSHVSTYDRELAVRVDRERARFSAWYELFPRSCAAKPGKHGTFRDVIDRLHYVADLGFDVVYLPPIHPIGAQFRKGKNNALTAEPDDVGSPWAIGGKEGGHKAIHPDLGTLDDFHALVRAAENLNMEIALDIAFQCSPDHPYVKEHPAWFRKRPDGTIQYAENPPKKYQDIYPFDFETDDWEALWIELRSIMLYWIEQGVRIFRVDNPHTKSLPFWGWAIETIQNDHPDTIFLAEAFTRPKVMYTLAKLGFTQSYTYYAWRNAKWELEEYLTELTRTDVREFFRPNFWPNTPDILTEFLQTGGPAAFKSRLVLAATLAACYGIYGPAFELCENVPREPGSEEYLHSEKYQIRAWNLEHPDSLRGLIARVNQVRRDNPALQTNDNLVFHPTDNEQIICFSKADARDNVIIVVVNLDFSFKQAGWVNLRLDDLGLRGDEPFHVRDELSGARYIWQGGRNYVELDPAGTPAHVFRVRPHLRTEQDFDTYH